MAKKPNNLTNNVAELPAYRAQISTHVEVGLLQVADKYVATRSSKAATERQKAAEKTKKEVEKKLTSGEITLRTANKTMKDMLSQHEPYTRRNLIEDALKFYLDNHA